MGDEVRLLGCADVVQKYPLTISAAKRKKLNEQLATLLITSDSLIQKTTSGAQNQHVKVCKYHGLLQRHIRHCRRRDSLSSLIFRY